MFAETNCNNESTKAMIHVINILLITCCLWLAFEDFKNRQISLWLTLVAGILIITSFFFTSGIMGLKEVLINILFVAGLFLLSFYFAWRKEKNIFELIGEGDWIMLLLFAFAFNPLGFTSFITVAYITAVISTLLFRVSGKKQQTVPLAGVLCLAYVLELAIKYTLPEPSLLISQILVR